MKNRKDSKKSLNGQVFKRLLKYAMPYWKFFIISFIGFGLYAATQPLFAMVIKHIIDILGANNKEEISSNFHYQND